MPLLTRLLVRLRIGHRWVLVPWLCLHTLMLQGPQAVYIALSESAEGPLLPGSERRTCAGAGLIKWQPQAAALPSLLASAQQQLQAATTSATPSPGPRAGSAAVGAAAAAAAPAVQPPVAEGGGAAPRPSPASPSPAGASGAGCALSLGDIVASDPSLSILQW